MSRVTPGPPPPADSWIEAGQDEQGRLVLSWREPVTWAGYLVGCAFALGSLALLGYFVLRLLALALARWADLFRGNWPAGLLGVILVLVLLGMTVVLSAVLLAGCGVAIAFLRGSPADRLTLGPSLLRCESRGWYAPPWGRVYEVPRAELGEVRLEVTPAEPGDRVKPGQRLRRRLTVERGAQVFEVGRRLREPDRAWLAGALRAWAGERQRPPRAGWRDGPPAGSAITAEHGPDGTLRLCWRSGPALVRRWWTAVVNACGGLLASAFALAVVVFMLISLLRSWGGWGGLELVMVVPLACSVPSWLFPAGCFAAQLWALLRRPRTERLTLAPACLRREPACYVDAQDMRYLDGRHIHSEPPHEAPLSELGPIRLEQMETGRRLTVDHGAERIEIGPTLSDPEREWLAEVLRAWADRGAQPS